MKIHVTLMLNMESWGIITCCKAYDATKQNKTKKNQATTPKQPKWIKAWAICDIFICTLESGSRYKSVWFGSFWIISKHSKHGMASFILYFLRIRECAKKNTHKRENRLKRKQVGYIGNSYMYLHNIRNRWISIDTWA